MKNPLIQALLLFVTVVLLRLPFLSAGFGMDPDSWQMALGARYIAETGHYVTSRLPGYPMPEIIYSLIPESYFLFNLLSAIFTAIAAIFFLLLLRHFRLPLPFLTSLAFSAIPIIFISSTSSIDYMWALAFILASLYSASKNNLLLAGLLLGISMSCRVTSILMVLPLFFLLPLQPVRKYIQFGTAGVIGSLLYFIPVISSYGWNFLRYKSGPDYPPLRLLQMATEDLWGRVGLVVLGVVICLQIVDWLKRKDVLNLDAAQKRLVMAGSVGLIIYLILFLYLPHEPGYLIPAVLWFLLLLSSLLNRRLLLVFLAGCLISPFITFGQTGIYAGPVFLNNEYREYNLAHFKVLLQKLEQKEMPIMLIAGWHSHALNYLKKEPDSRLLIVYRVEADGEITHYHFREKIKNLQDIRERGYHIMLIKEMQAEYKASEPEPELIVLFPDLEK